MSGRFSRRTARSAIAAMALVALGAAPAFAFWATVGAGSGIASTTTVDKANTPTASISGSTVLLSWTASTLANGVPVSSYDVLRHDGGATTTVCSAVADTSCFDHSPAAGTVQYGVVARQGSSWTGPESDLSEPFTFDSAAPTTTITRDPAEPTSTWYTADVQVTLTATDGAGSGVKQIRYTLNGGVEQVSGANPTVFTVSREDANALVFWAVDNAGNAEAPHDTAAVKIDKTAPVTTTSVSGTSGTNGWYTSDVTVNLSPTDTSPVVGASSSGVSKTEYQLNSTVGPWTAGTSVSITTAGTTTVNFRSTDLAGNVEPTKSVDIKVDKALPSFGFSYPALSSSNPPATSSIINRGQWNGGCGSIGDGLCGTVSDASPGSGLATGAVQFELRRTQNGSTTCLSGTSFSAANCGTYQTATLKNSNANWSIPLAYGNLLAGSYELRLKVTDTAGNTTRSGAAGTGAADLTFTNN